ncbi:MAG: tripartite tricarboxylate transporter TctB family protein [Pygmaiobacter massiliensis]|nr:tripartite tricarboxylate transporter TctB family protein [Pygmaiobacter massiliensis]
MKEYLLKKMALPTIVLIWAGAYYIEVMGYSVKNHRLIQPIFWIMALLYIINGVTDYRAYQRRKSEAPPVLTKKDPVNREHMTRVLAIIGIMAGYVALLKFLGFVISTFLFGGAILYFMGEKKWYKVVGIPLVLVTALYLIFRIGLSIPLPTGFLGI